MAAFSLLPDQAAGTAILSRFVLGMSLTAVYPVGMKMVAGWHRGWRVQQRAGRIGLRALGAYRQRPAAMLARGSIAVFVGFLPTRLAVPIVIVVVIWGLSMVTDYAQFSTAMSELDDAIYVGTALILKTGLGFLLTILPILLLPIVQGAGGCGVALAMLAVGPALGTLAMLWLRRIPEARAMAEGRR